MAESTLSVTFDDLKAAIGFYLGYGGPSKWTGEQESEIVLYVRPA